MTVPHRHQTVAVAMPGEIRPVVAAVGELALSRAVRADEEDLVPAGPLRGEGQGGPVRGPDRALVVVFGGAGEGSVLAAVQVDDVDGRAVAVGVGREDVGHLGAVGRRCGSPAVPVAGGHRYRPRVVGVDLDEHGAPVAFDGRQEKTVGGPHRVATLDDRDRRSPFEVDQPDPALVRVGHADAVGRDRRPGVLPVRHEPPSGGQPRRRSGQGVDRPEVGGVPVPDEGHRAPVGADGEVTGSLRRGHRLQAPVRWWDHVGPSGDGQPAPLHRAQPGHVLSHHGSPRSRRARRAPGRRACPGRSRPPARRPWGGRARRGYGLPRRSRTR